MTTGPPFDARGVANLLLEMAAERGLTASNIVLQKLLYFAHGVYLTVYGGPLVSGYFEAWKFGPVHPAVYQVFKSAGDSPIDFRARRIDVVSGVTFPIASPDSPEVRGILERVLIAYGTMTPGRLVEISHAKHAPWYYVVNRGASFGMRISDNVIKEKFKHHKVSVGLVPRSGEPRDDSPLA